MPSGNLCSCHVQFGFGSRGEATGNANDRPSALRPEPVGTKGITDLHAAFGGDRLPPGQRETTRFPVLSKGGRPDIPDEPTREVRGPSRSRWS